MAAKTDFSQNEFVELLEHYNLGEYRSSKPLKSGTVQTNYLISTSQGQFIFKYYESRTPGSVRFEVNLLHYIRQQDYPCPAPLRNRQGEMVGLYGQKAYVFFEFVDGHHLAYLNEAQQRQVIHVAARLQQITRSYQPRLRQFRWNYDRELCWQLAQTEAQKIGTSNARAKLDWFEQQLAAMKLPPALPKGICHADYDLSNLLFHDDQLVALVDFDDANYTYLTFDLVNLIDGWAWSYQGVLDLDYARQIVQTYEQVRPLSGIERCYLFDVHQLQIMFDGIWFYARGDAADFYERQKIDYLNSLGREAYSEAVC